jgi:hypothetical protein
VYPPVLVRVTPIWNGVDVRSENPSGAVNQQGSPSRRPYGVDVTPQRLHAELLAVGAKGLEAYLQGALRDGTYSALHRTHRFCQSNEDWLDVLGMALSMLGHRSWKYREGRSRKLWVLETTAKFLDLEFNPISLIGTQSGLSYVRGYFDSDGGMPRNAEARMYVQLCQKDKASLEKVAEILTSWNVECGRVHNPSVRVDPDYWRVFVRSRSHESFMRLVSSWHPVKRHQINTRMKI